MYAYNNNNNNNNNNNAVDAVQDVAGRRHDALHGDHLPAGGRTRS